MTDDPTVDTQQADVVYENSEPAVIEDVLVEEVSIDGMCGVY